jgi:hypothetical protein
VKVDIPDKTAEWNIQLALLCVIRNLNAWSRVLLQKLKVAQLIKKFHAPYGT